MTEKGLTWLPPSLVAVCLHACLCLFSNQLRLKHHMFGAVKGQLWHLLRGFYDVIPAHLISVFDYQVHRYVVYKGLVVRTDAPFFIPFHLFFVFSEEVRILAFLAPAPLNPLHLFPIFYIFFGRRLSLARLFRCALHCSSMPSAQLLNSEIRRNR